MTHNLPPYLIRFKTNYDSTDCSKEKKWSSNKITAFNVEIMWLSIEMLILLKIDYSLFAGIKHLCYLLPLLKETALKNKWRSADLMFICCAADEALKCRRNQSIIRALIYLTTISTRKWSMLLPPLKCIRRDESKVWWELSGPSQMTHLDLRVWNTGHLKQQRSCLWCDESPLGPITDVDSVCESQKNKQQRGKADVGGTNILAASLWSITFPWKSRATGWMWEQPESHPRGPELQPALINNQPQNMSALDLFLPFEVWTCWSNPCRWMWILSNFRLWSIIHTILERGELLISSLRQMDTTVLHDTQCRFKSVDPADLPRVDVWIMIVATGIVDAAHHRVLVLWGLQIVKKTALPKGAVCKNDWFSSLIPNSSKMDTSRWPNNDLQSQRLSFWQVRKLWLMLIFWNLLSLGEYLCEDDGGACERTARLIH